MGALYVVGTPIGNLEDITLRALRVLREADLIACEDTRMTKRLLARYEIAGKRLISFNAHASDATVASILEVLRQGGSVAQVSDAGTPSISDPGCVLVAAVRAAVPDVPVLAVPGPSAVAAALSVSGIPASDFLFLGFLPHKKGRETLFAEIEAQRRAAVFYESPHRLMKTLRSLSASLDPERTVFVARELTKVFEQCISGSATEVCSHFEKSPGQIRGEFVIIVGPMMKRRTQSEGSGVMADEGSSV